MLVRYKNILTAQNKLLRCINRSICIKGEKLLLHELLKYKYAHVE